MVILVFLGRGIGVAYDSVSERSEQTDKTATSAACVTYHICTGVGQCLVSGHQWSSSARQSLDARQKTLNSIH